MIFGLSLRLFVCVCLRCVYCFNDTVAFRVCRAINAVPVRLRLPSCSNAAGAVLFVCARYSPDAFRTYGSFWRAV